MKRFIADAKMKDILDLFKREIMSELNCHAIGTIDSFNASNQTSKIKISYKKTQMVRGTDGVYYKEYIAYPILLDCPTVSLRGGSAGITLPIKKGDACIVFFNDKNIDNWFAGAMDKEPDTPRMHSMADGLALVGISSLSQLIAGYDASNVVIYNGATTKIVVKSDKISIENSVGKLGLILKELTDALKNFQSTNCVVGSPVLMSPATKSAIDAVVVKIQGLLE